ncbi:MAG: DUF971 domain-containing protein [Magnetococcales bacterium]|nr:DUF971 domain-containing protein [Magnetococcales bacterium]
MSEEIIYGTQQFPTEIKQQNDAKQVIIAWDTGESFTYSMEYLRVMCPCADCRGHHPSQKKLIFGKKGVGITAITPVGHYAVKIAFDDEHSSGVFSFENLYDLGKNHDEHWEEYLVELKAGGKSRMMWNITQA